MSLCSNGLCYMLVAYPVFLDIWSLSRHIYIFILWIKGYGDMYIHTYATGRCMHACTYYASSSPGTKKYFLVPVIADTHLHMYVHNTSSG